MTELETTDRCEQFAFGEFVLDVNSGALTFDGKPVPLAPKVYSTLLYLVRNSGRIVTKDELFTTIWGDAFVEDGSLSYTISQLRKTLAAYDSSRPYIETISRRGFRFIEPIAIVQPEHRKNGISAVVEEVWISDDSIAPNASAPAMAKLAGATPRPAKWGHRRTFVAAAATLALFVLVIAAWRYNTSYAGTNARSIERLAVLPIRGFDGDDIDRSLVLRVTDSLITKLGSIDSLSVTPTSSVAQIGDDQTDAIAVGRLLKVDAVLDGRMQREGGRIRLTTQLISVATGEQLWAEQFDGREDDLLDLQDAIATFYLTKLRPDASKTELASFQKRPTSNSEAFEEYLRGRYFWNSRTPNGLDQAISSFERAVSLDPKFAAAYVGLADSYYLKADYSYDTSTINIDRAKAFLANAIEIDPDMADAYVTLGLIKGIYEWKWNEAETAFKKAIEISPRSSNAHHRYGFMMLKQRRFAEANAALSTARTLDPTSRSITMNVGVVNYYWDKIPEAEEYFALTRELDRNFSPVIWYTARASWRAGRRKESLDHFLEALKLTSDTESIAYLTDRIADTPPETVLRGLAEIWSRKVSPTGYNPHNLAILCAMYGDRDAALNWIERSVNERHPWAADIFAAPEFKPLHDSPRFIAAMAKMGLG